MWPMTLILKFLMKVLFDVTAEKRSVLKYTSTQFIKRIESTNDLKPRKLLCQILSFNA